MVSGPEKKRAPQAVTPQRLAHNRMVVANKVLPVLIARTGGSVTITKEEFDEVKGPLRRILGDDDGDGGGGRPGPIRVTLAREPAAQGELPV